MLETKTARERGIWFASTRWGVQAYPVTWQGWLATLAYTVFVIAMVGFAEAMPRGPITFGVIAFVFVVTGFYLHLIFRHLRQREKG